MTETHTKNPQRSTINDGFRNKLEFFLLTHLGLVWRVIHEIGFLKRKVNKLLINSAIYKTKTRPYPFSTKETYTSWDSLTDRTYSGRHLPAVAQYPASLPPVDEVVKLFERQPGRMIQSSKSTVLFANFAQWFTDGFLRTDHNDRLKNTSNHDIDLSPLYGLNQRSTELLRSHEGGRLRSQLINGEEYPPYYFDDNGTAKKEFKDLPLVLKEDIDPVRKAKLFALGGDRGNIHIGYVMLNTLFLREHNRICKLLSRENANWDDERLFQTARNVLTVLLIKIVIEEYINHITPYHFKFTLDPHAFPNERWYRQNWMSIEFNLLYRWHSLVPDYVGTSGQYYATEQTFWNNDLITSRGLGPLFQDASLQPSGEMGLFNTATFLLEAEAASIRLGRLARLPGYNDYRAMCGYPRVTAFDQISGRSEVQQELERLYGSVDNIEFYVGLFAEDVREYSAVAPLVGRLVGVDAFSQALTNPLLAENVFNTRTFSSTGLRVISQTKNLSEILHRNIPDQDKSFKVSFTSLPSKG